MKRIDLPKTASSVFDPVALSGVSLGSTDISATVGYVKLAFIKILHVDRLNQKGLS